jgi:hypothetical protein
LLTITTTTNSNNNNNNNNNNIIIDDVREARLVLRHWELMPLALIFQLQFCKAPPRIIRWGYLSSPYYIFPSWHVARLMWKTRVDPNDINITGSSGSAEAS